jgi:CDP-diacylglycerol--glycerol-3-phosphate 3-phosphatidyltransferase
VILIVVYVLIEVSDVLDGHIARSKDLVSDYGKLMDPFADTISRLTYFVCFAAVGIMPVWALMVIIYREFGIVFIRMLMYRHGQALAARGGGKLKATFYALGGFVGILIVLTEYGWLRESWTGWLRPGGTIVFSLAAALALVSFMDYLRVYRSFRAGTEDS